MNWERAVKVYRRISQVSVISGLVLLFVGSWVEINSIVVTGIILVTTTLLSAILYSSINSLKEPLDIAIEFFQRAFTKRQ